MLVARAASRRPCGGVAAPGSPGSGSGISDGGRRRLRLGTRGRVRGCALRGRPAARRAAAPAGAGGSPASGAAAAAARRRGGAGGGCGARRVRRQRRRRCAPACIGSSPRVLGQRRRAQRPRAQALDGRGQRLGHLQPALLAGERRGPRGAARSRAGGRRGPDAAPAPALRRPPSIVASRLTSARISPSRPSMRRCPSRIAASSRSARSRAPRSACRPRSISWARRSSSATRDVELGFGAAQAGALGGGALLGLGELAAQLLDPPRQLAAVAARRPRRGA